MTVKIVMALTARRRYACTSFRLFLVYNLGKTSVDRFLLSLYGCRRSKQRTYGQETTASAVMGATVVLAFDDFHP